MLIGILSDSHGHSEIVGRAMRLFDSLGVETVVHCGDIGGADVLDHLVGRSCGFVWGNMDAVDGGLRAYVASVDLPHPPATAPLRLEVGGKVVLVFHGHERGFRRAVDAGEANYVLCGHTHTPRDERVGGVRVINPGALYRAAYRTVATLDTVADEVRFYAESTPGGDFAPWVPAS